MALNFPQNPEIDDTYTDQTANTTWKFDGLGWSVISQDETLSLTAGNEVTIEGEYPSFTISSNVVLPNNFGTISVADQDSIAADISSDTLNFIAGENINIVTDSNSDSVTISSTNSTDLTSFSVTVGNASGNGNLTYDNNGTFLFTPANIPNTSDFLTAASLNIVNSTSENIPLNSGGNLFFRESDTTLIFTPADTANKLSKSAINVTIATTPSGGGNLTHNALNAGSFTFTPAEVRKELTYIWPIGELPGGTTPNYVLNAADYQIFQQDYDSTANWEINIRGDANNSLNNYMVVGETITVVFIAPQGTTAYYPTQLQIDGVNVTPIWSFGNAPVAGTASATDVYSYTITKTAGDTYTVLANASFYQ